MERACYWPIKKEVHFTSRCDSYHFIKNKANGICTLDCIITVCSALCNMCSAVVPFDKLDLTSTSMHSVHIKHIKHYNIHVNYLNCGLSRENWSGRKVVRADHFWLPKLVRHRTTFGCQKWSGLPKVVRVYQLAGNRSLPSDVCVGPISICSRSKCISVHTAWQICASMYY